MNLKLKIKYRKRQRRRHSQRTLQETDHKCALISCQQLQLDDWLVCHWSVNSKRTKRATPKLYAGTTAVIKSVIPIQHEMTGEGRFIDQLLGLAGWADVDGQKKVRLGGVGLGRGCLRRRCCCRRLHSRKIDPAASEKEIYEAVT